MGALIGGIIAVVLGIWGLVGWWDLFLKGLKAAVPFFLFTEGISYIKDKIEEKKEKEKEKEEEKKEEEKKE